MSETKQTEHAPDCPGQPHMKGICNCGVEERTLPYTLGDVVQMLNRRVVVLEDKVEKLTKP